VSRGEFRETFLHESFEEVKKIDILYAHRRIEPFKNFCKRLEESIGG
jgi:hypothetical protein